jgi:hypothetical protein
MDAIARVGPSPTPDKFQLSSELLRDLAAFGENIAVKFGYIKSLKEHPELDKTAKSLVSRLGKELGPDYEIINEMT